MLFLPEQVQKKTSKLQARVHVSANTDLDSSIILLLVCVRARARARKTEGENGGVLACDGEEAEERGSEAQLGLMKRGSLQEHHLTLLSARDFSAVRAALLSPQFPAFVMSLAAFPSDLIPSLRADISARC